MVIEKELCRAHAAFTPHLPQQENAAAGLQLVPAAWKPGALALPGQAWGRISGGVLSLLSSHLQACVFRTL